MDVQYFLTERTQFIRYFYENSSAPFRETIRKIEAKESPFEPPYSEDGGEPPFMDEWSEASTALEIMGRTCVSMLSESLKLYFKTWEVKFSCAKNKKEFKKGFVYGYKAYFSDALKINWNNCPADFSILEQITLARNNDQHPENITSMQATHTKKDLEKYPKLFFVKDSERDLFTDPDDFGNFWMAPTVHVSREMLFASINEVEALAKWLENEITEH